MSPPRHTLRLPSFPRLATLAVAGATLVAAACADAPTAPASARLAPGAPSASIATKNTFSLTTVGDTTIARISLVPGGRGAAYYIGAGQHLDLSGGAEVVCDLATSSYGTGTWDLPCAPENDPVTITARTWIDADGLAHAEFSPALRFVPDASVQLYLNSRTGVDVSRQKIRYCAPETGCIDEARTDPTVATTVVSGTQLTRRVKHFSGYNVVVDRYDEGAGLDGY